MTTSFRFGIEVQGDIEKIMRAQVARVKQSVQTGIGGATLAVKQNWRDQIKGAGLGNRLANAVRANVYPKDHASINAAGFVFTKAPEIIAAHDQGALIKSANGFWLAIPLAAAGPKGRGGKKLTPAEWERKTGRRLKFIYRKGRSALLVDTGTKAAGNVFVTRKTRGGSRLAEPTTFNNRSVPIFVLVPQVKLRKKFSLVASAEGIAAGIPNRIAAALRA